MTTNHPFTIGNRYRNRSSSCDVLAIDGDTMTVRYDSGRRQTLNVDAQARIWRNIHDDELAEARRSDFTGRDFSAEDERLVTWPVRQLGQRRAANAVHGPLSARHHQSGLLPGPSRPTPTGCAATTPPRPPPGRQRALGRVEGQQRRRLVVKNLAGMVTVKAGVTATSGFIKSYSRLGYAEKKSLTAARPTRGPMRRNATPESCARFA